MSKKENFIMTKDKETADKLITLGFKVVNNSNGITTFLNCPAKMSGVKEDKITYTNKLCV